MLKGEYHFNYHISENASICMNVDNILAHQPDANYGYLGFTINFTDATNWGSQYENENLLGALYGYLYVFFDITTGEIVDKGFDKRDVVDTTYASVREMSVYDKLHVSLRTEFNGDAEANFCQSAFGHYNDTSLAAEGDYEGTEGTAIVIGNGTYEGNGDDRVYTYSNACRITYAGQVIGKQAYSTTGADYAEYFEWADANIDNEERVGYFVTFEDGRFIRKANENDYILGIVSGNPAILGNHDEGWMGQNEMDEWGRFIYETKTKVDEKTKEERTYTTYKVNPNYDRKMTYIPRAERPEWAAIGMLGVLAVRDDGTCQVNGYCKVADGGIATASDTGYRVIERVTDNIIKVVFR